MEIMMPVHKICSLVDCLAFLFCLLKSFKTKKAEVNELRRTLSNSAHFLLLFACVFSPNPTC